MSIQTDKELLARLVDQVVQMSIEHVSTGGIPFTALVVDRRGNVLGSGINRVYADSDPTAHAEVMAIRDAAKNLETPGLRSATLIASGEPCAMCYVAALFSGVSRIVFAVDRHGAAQGGFDYRDSYELFALDPVQWPIDVHHFPTRDAHMPFEIWRQQQGPL